MHLEILRRDIRQHRIVDSRPPARLQDGHVLMRLERAALTANNISYALSGDLLDYWGFFPAEDGWGRLPVMGFGVVTDSRCSDVPVGGRYFGFFPLGDHHVVHAQAARSGFIDSAAWREKHAMAYRSFDPADPSPNDDATLVLRGLFLTSYLLNDFLQENAYFSAERIVITSASSKTAIALAHCVQRTSSVRVVGLTSQRNVSFTQGVGEYDEVLAYDRIESLQPDSSSIVVDMAGNRRVVAELHTRLGANLRYSSSVGATHWDASRGDVSIPPPRPEFFFAPSQLAKRGKEWGREVLNQRITESLQMFIGDSGSWLEMKRCSGDNEISALYSALVSGDVEPSVGNIVTFHGNV